MLCHPEPFWKCCDTEPLCFSDTLVPKEPSGSQAENVSLCIQPTACQDSSVWRHLGGSVGDISPSFFSLCLSLAFAFFTSTEKCSCNKLQAIFKIEFVMRPCYVNVLWGRVLSVCLACLSLLCLLLGMASGPLSPDYPLTCCSSSNQPLLHKGPAEPLPDHSVSIILTVKSPTWWNSLNSLCKSCLTLLFCASSNPASRSSNTPISVSSQHLLLLELSAITSPLDLLPSRSHPVILLLRFWFWCLHFGSAIVMLL